MNKEERRKQDIEWVRYFVKRIASYWIVAIEVVPLIVILEIIGLHIIAFYLTTLMIGLILGAEMILGAVRDFCLKNNIDPKTFKKLGIE